MNKILTLTFLMLGFILCEAQTIINPAFERSDVPAFYIKRVEITKDTTYVYCIFYAEAGSWASVSKDTYLRDSKSHKIFSLQRCEGLPYSPEERIFPQNESCELLFCFPSIVGIEQFDFIENEGEGGFNIYNVNLNKELKTSYSDTELKRISEMVCAYDSSDDTEKAMQLKEYATSLNNLISYNVSRGKYAEAIRLGTVEVEIREKVFGKEHPSCIESLGLLARCYSASGNYAEAIQLQIEITKAFKKTLGPENISYIKSLSSLIYLNSKLGNYTESIRLGTEAKEEMKKAFETAPQNYAIFLCNIAGYHLFVGNYTEALQLQIEATELLKKTLGSENANYAIALGNLALYNSKLGNYVKAIEIETEAMEIFKKVLGAEHPDYAMSLNNLTTYNLACGNYAEAIKLGTEAMEICKCVLGTEHPDYALSLNNLAQCNSKLGNYTEAVMLETNAMEILKKVLGIEHPNYATSLSNLAVLYSDLGNNAEAIRLETEAMEIRKSVFGTEHPVYAQSLINLAYLNTHLGNYASAKRNETEAMEILRSVFGTEHPDYATSLSNLAGLYSDLGNNAEAIKLETEAMEIRRSVLGTENLDYAMSLGNLADSYSRIGNYEKAYYYLKQQIERSNCYILKNLGVLSSNYQQSLWTTQFEYTYFSIFPFLVSKYKNKDSISELYNNACLFAKGILLNTGIEVRKLILESGNPILIKKYDILSTNINIYNRLVEKPIKERFINIDSLDRVIQKQEMELAREAKDYGDYTRNLVITWKDVQRNLKKDDIAIEFLNYPLVGMNSTMYVALTLKKGYDSPHMVTLFEEKQLKTIPENVYYTQTDVSDLVWEPLEEELKDVRNIYFAPSGELHRIGIEYLPISETNIIGDIYTVHRLSSTRQLAVVQDETKGKNTILYGGINYDEKSKTISTDSASTKELLRSAFISRANVGSLSLRNTYEYLEGTKKEADLIAEDMKQHSAPYKYYCGSDATEESFKNLNGTKPMVMHIATHGFYYTEAETEKSHFSNREIVLLAEGSQNVGKVVENKPMTRSGLLFSGCNHAIRHERIPEGEENGILTAQEISTLDLRGLNLVVLSACQTGLGDIISGEGVFGLQRGFKKAGAKTIIMSLWNVNDESTMKMMTSFYHHYLEGMSKEKAFHAAQDELRKNSSAHQERPDWAAFILLDGLN